MSDTITCPECGEEVDSVEQLEEGHEVPEIEVEDDGSFSLFRNRDLFLCKNCKNPLGMGK
ncbi:hypothetical protein [Halorubrum tebenquichense]|uniref:hypothetical protein n=1 Tax=Halorubrum tebenquichense TaxID=119434 RepID=UPI000677710A|nr:hypothetical protein [Halorubrum tebenquichense]